jgi:acetyltransferase, GNAT family
MTIRKAKQEDIPKLLDLLQQILTVHHQAQPDIFKKNGSKYSASDLQNILSQ